MHMSDPLPYVLSSLHVRITKVFPAQVRECLAQLDDEQIWWRPNESSNSVGNLVIHLSGSLNHYLNRGIGGFEYDRDRAAEFAERRHIPKDELLAIFDDMVSKAEQTFDALTVDRPYSTAVSMAAARERIREASGTHFDPEVVATFLALPIDLFEKARAASPARSDA